MNQPAQGWPARWALARRLGAALLPASCALCGMASMAAVCADCQARFLAAAPGAQRGRCRRCANRLADPRWPCAACLSAPPAYDATVAVADYAAPLDQLVLELKFGACLALAPWMGRMLAQAARAQDAAQLPALLCPVPLGPGRLAERGFNQALEIARPLARALGLPLRARLALRWRETAAQSGVSPAERGKNIRHAFTVAPDALALVRGQHIGVVDDVMTSGATLGELAATLKRFGAARVSNYVFARTPPH